jgi:hypothetical protein
MEKEEFVAILTKAGFVDEGDGDFFKSGQPDWAMNINEDGAFGSYNWGGDTGPIELTPTRVPLDEMMEDLELFHYEALE